MLDRFPIFIVAFVISVFSVIIGIATVAFSLGIHWASNGNADIISSIIGVFIMGCIMYGFQAFVAGLISSLASIVISRKTNKINLYIITAGISGLLGGISCIYSPLGPVGMRDNPFVLFGVIGGVMSSFAISFMAIRHTRSNQSLKGRM